MCLFIHLNTLKENVANYFLQLWSSFEINILWHTYSALKATLARNTNTCPVALNQERFTWRHHSVLQQITRAVKSSKPDMLILNREQRTVALLELTSPLPSSSHKAPLVSKKRLFCKKILLLPFLGLHSREDSVHAKMGAGGRGLPYNPNLAIKLLPPIFMLVLSCWFKNSFSF